MLTETQRESFAEQGFVIARGLLPQSAVDQCLAEIRLLFHDQAVKTDRLPASEENLDDLIRSVMVPGTPERSFVYHLAGYLRSVRSFESRPEIQQVLEEIGLQLPISLEFPSVRFDAPEESQFLTKCHQDVRSIRSARCVTVWIPLRRVDAFYGTVDVFPGTHLHGLIPHVLEDKHVKVPDEYLTTDPLPVDADPGDVVFMNSFVIHRSHPNSSDRIKLNSQIFFNDALAMTMADEYQALSAIPDYKDL